MAYTFRNALAQECILCYLGTVHTKNLLLRFSRNTSGSDESNMSYAGDADLMRKISGFGEAPDVSTWLGRRYGLFEWTVDVFLWGKCLVKALNTKSLAHDSTNRYIW